MPALYVVATPIGNLGDLSPRAREILEHVGLIAAEDTRVTRALLNHFNIHTPCISNHRHNEADKAESIVERMLSENIDAALVTDAGTPAISDPGSFLVDEAVRAGIPVYAVPGANAMVSALSVSGFDTRSFGFYGFLPRKKSELVQELKRIASGSVPVAVVHESPHRVIELVETIAEILPECRISASCDLTKFYEKTIRGKAEEVLELLRANEKAEKGEYCLVLDMHDVKMESFEQTMSADGDAEPEMLLLRRMLEGEDLKTAMQKLRDAGIRRNQVYAAGERIKELFISNFGEEEDE
ncbi:MAG: 16S rRNA (cytidine(1402)-2'-O)-methyltransferase [Clostridia bacterium]|nr:16S rRNA (cytidine(1402)-2'-O)-methyltransferase [Clostridia bacterium]